MGEERGRNFRVHGTSARTDRGAGERRRRTRALRFPALACCLALAAIAATVLAAPATRAPDHIAVDDPSWHLESSSDGIALYSGSVPEVRLVPLKAVMTIPGTIEDVALVLEDIQRR